MLPLMLLDLTTGRTGSDTDRVRVAETFFNVAAETSTKKSVFPLSKSIFIA